jgi:hypothetical protein
MQLAWLDFDFSDEDSGRCSYDAMASVVPQRLPVLLAEIGEVLQWATSTFGPPQSQQDEGEWGFELQASAEPDAPLSLHWDEGTREVAIGALAEGCQRVQVTLTLSGSPAFCESFGSRYDLFD